MIFRALSRNNWVLLDSDLGRFPPQKIRSSFLVAIVRDSNAKLTNNTPHKGYVLWKAFQRLIEWICLKPTKLYSLSNRAKTTFLQNPNPIDFHESWPDFWNLHKFCQFFEQTVKFAIAILKSSIFPDKLTLLEYLFSTLHQSNFLQLFMTEK